MITDSIMEHKVITCAQCGRVLNGKRKNGEPSWFVAKRKGWMYKQDKWLCDKCVSKFLKELTKLVKKWQESEEVTTSITKKQRQ